MPHAVAILSLIIGLAAVCTISYACLTIIGD